MMIRFSEVIIVDDGPVTLQKPLSKINILINLSKISPYSKFPSRKSLCVLTGIKQAKGTMLFLPILISATTH